MKKCVPIFVLAAMLFLAQTVMAAETPNRSAVSDAEGSITIINLYDLEKEASQKIPKAAFGYVQSGAEDEITLRNNTSAFDRKQIIPNGLTGVETVDTKTQFLGIDLPSPIILTPMAAHGLVHKEADKATIKGVQKAGTIMSISNYSSLPISETAASSPNTPFFFQIYMNKDQEYNKFVIEKAKEAGAKAIILTIDTGVAGNREADKRNNYTYGAQTPIVAEYYESRNMSQSEARAARKVGFTAEDIKYIKEISGLPVLVKGVMSPEAANLAIKAGADGIWVSNHGGRQLDSAPATFDVLPLIAKAVNGRVPIVFDSGVRRGTHVFKALASGADIIGIGRPVLYGLILGGSEGVHDVFQQLNKELSTTMALAGTKNIEEVKKNKLFDPEKEK